MKRGVLIALAALSMAGAASANLLTTASQGATAQPPAPEKPSPVKALLADSPTNLVPHSVVQPVAQPSPAPPLRKASLEVRQAPVPLHVKPRVPVALPNIDTTEAYAKGEAGVPAGKAGVSATTTGENTGDKTSEAAARAAIEADGYKGVQVLRKGVNGVWHAKALRGKTEVQVVVDSRGFVTTAD